jgi:hypothetical protein
MVNVISETRSEYGGQDKESASRGVEVIDFKPQMLRRADSS